MSLLLPVEYPLGKLGNTFFWLYNQMAHNPLPEVVTGLPLGMVPLLELVYKGKKTPVMVECSELPAIERYYSQNEAVVCFSGGTDSVAAVCRLQKEGKQVSLFHVNGLNRATARAEMSAASGAAKALGMDLVSIQVRYKGKNEWIENPVRNNFILGMAIDFWLGRSVGAPIPLVFALGNMVSHRLNYGVDETGFSDCIEVLNATGSFLMEYAGILVRTVLDNNTDSTLEVLNAAPQVLPLVHSCIVALPHQVDHRKKVVQKFGVDLMPGRCGACHKCASEWLHMYLTKAVEANEAYADYCVQALIRNYRRHYVSGQEVTQQQVVDYFIDPVRLPNSQVLYGSRRGVEGPMRVPNAS